jgi:lipoprotein-anchoring transpeptidase ErfK/SrfK
MSLLALLLAACSTNPSGDTSAHEPDTTPTSAVTIEQTEPTPLPPTPTPPVYPTVTPVLWTPTPEPTATAEPTETPTPEPTPTEEVIEEPTAEIVEEPVLDGDPGWYDAIQTPDGAYIGVVESVALNIRARPSLSARIVDETFRGHPVTIYDAVYSEDDGSLWYKLGPKRFVAAHLISPFYPTAPEEMHYGYWIDVNLTDFYAVAYVDSTPVYAAIITAGRDERTPLGVFEVLYRVRSETMDSATVGIPKGDPEYYYLENVEFTQYFKAGGFAIHGNYWTDPANFGGFTSNGCIGMMNHDAGWFWDFLSEGSIVSIHF